MNTNLFFIAGAVITVLLACAIILHIVLLYAEKRSRIMNAKARSLIKKPKSTFSIATDKKADEIKKDTHIVSHTTSADQEHVMEKIFQDSNIFRK